MKPDSKFKPFQPLIHFVFPLVGISIFLFFAVFNDFIYAEQTSGDFMAWFFQIAFILFLISPPLIVVLLFCIYKELKKRNEK